jgi:hypothetical protein
VIEQYMAALAATAKDNAELVAEVEQLLTHMRKVATILASHAGQAQSAPAMIRQKFIADAHKVIQPAYTGLAEAILGAGLAAMDVAMAKQDEQDVRNREMTRALQQTTAARKAALSTLPVKD